MFERIVNSLVHPSKIALCFKDKVWQPISLVLGFFMLLLFVEGMIAINSTYFDRTLCNQVMSVVANIEDESNLIYKDNKLKGDPIKSENSDISIGFLVDDLKYNNGLMFNFFEDRVDVFYQRESIGSYSFSKFDGEFSIKNIQDGVVKDKVIFSDLIYSSLEYLNNSLRINTFISTLGILSLYTIGIFLLLILYSYFINPGIKMNVRWKLCCYNLPIFYVLLFFSEAFNFYYLQFVALLMPFIYCRITFRHIIRVGK